MLIGLPGVLITGFVALVLVLTIYGRRSPDEGVVDRAALLKRISFLLFVLGLAALAVLNGTAPHARTWGVRAVVLAFMLAAAVTGFLGSRAARTE